MGLRRVILPETALLPDNPRMGTCEKPSGMAASKRRADAESWGVVRRIPASPWAYFVEPLALSRLASSRQAPGTSSGNWR